MTAVSAADLRSAAGNEEDRRNEHIAGTACSFLWSFSLPARAQRGR
jgi:hypothetical protein